MLPRKLRTRLGADEIRAVMEDKPRRKGRWQKVAINLLEVAGILLILLMLWIAEIAILGPAIDHELDRMHPGGHRPTAESVVVDEPVVDEDEPETLTMTATAYSWECGNGDDLTASMTPIREGVIAVDKSVIPLGSIVEIIGMGVFSAEDVGGAIKGNRVDIFMPSRSAALSYGRQTVEVRVVDQTSTSSKVPRSKVAAGQVDY